MRCECESESGQSLISHEIPDDFLMFYHEIEILDENIIMGWCLGYRITDRISDCTIPIKDWS